MKIFFSVARNADQGFTLVELSVTLSIAMILIGLAAPSFSNLVRQIRLSSATTELYSAIHLTKAEAIKRNSKVDLTAIGDNWKNGWVIKSNDNEQIMTHEPLHNDLTISAKFTDGTQHISFNGTGHSRTNSSTTASQSGHIYLSIGDNSRAIIVNFLGHVRVCNPAIDKFCTAVSAD